MMVLMKKDMMGMKDKMLATKKCVGCGYCCIKVQCAISHHNFGSQKRCSALKWNGVRYICELAEKHHTDLAIDAGCSSTLFNEWREEIKER